MGLFLASAQQSGYFKKLHIIQIRTVSLITGIMFLVYANVHYKMMPEDIALPYSRFHLFVIAPILFLTCFLSCKQVKYEVLRLLMITASLMTTSGMVIMVYFYPQAFGYYTESYLSLFWLFTVSGAGIWYAFFAALITAGITLLGLLSVPDLPAQEVAMHVFWLSCIFIFGLIIGYLLEMKDSLLQQKHEELKLLALADPLTGAYNRNYLHRYVRDEIARSQRFDHTFIFTMIDVDNFKSVNDQYGHPAGDKVLLTLVRIIQKHARSTDVVVRWGGDEFALLCPETSRDQGQILLNRICQEVANSSFGQVNTITLSLGATEFMFNDDIDELIRRADRALYQAKSLGRNQIQYA